MKTCINCKNEKDETDYSKDKRRADGLCPYCKDCSKLKHEVYRRKVGVPKRCKKKSKEELPKNKECTKCHLIKNKDGFRVREKDGYFYLNPSCKKCDVVAAKEYYEKHKYDLDYQKKNTERARRYDRKNEAYVKDRNKRKRQTPEYKKMMRDYRRKNKEKIYQQELITKHRYHEKNKTKITDKYVSHRLKSEGIEITPGNIEIKRTQILLHRLKRAIKSKPTGILKTCTRCKEVKDRSEFYRIGKTKKVTSHCKICSNKLSKQNREAKRSV